MYEEPLSARQLAGKLNVSVWSVRKWKREGRIPFASLGQKGTSVRYDLGLVRKALGIPDGKSAGSTDATP